MIQLLIAFILNLTAHHELSAWIAAHPVLWQLFLHLLRLHFGG